MNIILNGKLREINSAMTLRSLVEQFSKNPNHVIAEVNGNIITHDQWPSWRIQDGDTLELVNFVGGG